jgi:hypothetical protein
MLRINSWKPPMFHHERHPVFGVTHRNPLVADIVVAADGGLLWVLSGCGGGGLPSLIWQGPSRTPPAKQILAGTIV